MAKKKSKPAKQNASAKPAETPQSMGRWLLETAVLVALAIVLAQGIKAVLFESFVIPSGSMIPTIELKDRVLAEKISYRFIRKPRYKDIVVFDNPDPTDRTAKFFIKRVIAVGGQTVDIKNGKVVVDGKVLNEPYVHGKPTVPGTVPLPITIPEGDVWLMGDNRTNSSDARWFGPRPIATVRGRAFFTYWPPNHMGPLK